MKNFTATLALATALVVFPGIAEAGKVYSASDGFWTMNGYVEGNEASCVVSADYADGSRVNLNIFPKLDGAVNLTFTIKNVKWDNSEYPVGTAFPGDMIFRSKAKGKLEMEGDWQIKDKYTVIMREVHDTFVESFLKYDSLVVFPGSPSEVVILLDGTEAMEQNYNECLDAIFER